MIVVGIPGVCLRQDSVQAGKRNDPPSSEPGSGPGEGTQKQLRRRLNRGFRQPPGRVGRVRSSRWIPAGSRQHPSKRTGFGWLCEEQKCHPAIEQDTRGFGHCFPGGKSGSSLAPLPEECGVLVLPGGPEVACASALSIGQKPRGPINLTEESSDPSRQQCGGRLWLFSPHARSRCAARSARGRGVPHRRVAGRMARIGSEAGEDPSPSGGNFRPPWGLRRRPSVG
jgi:hypothetical protein